MSPPKPKPNKAPEDLAEVERALSVLHGRHPEHERVRREDEERKAARRAEIEAAAKVESQRILMRGIVMGLVFAGLAGVAVVASLIVRGQAARRAAIEKATDAYGAMGFVVVDSSTRDGPRIEANVPAGCLLATSTSPSRIRLSHPGGAEEGPGPLLACLCEGGRVTVTSHVKPGEGLVLLRADASVVGGSRAFAFLPFKPGTAPPTDQACEEGSLDAWLDAKRWPRASLPHEPHQPPPALRSAGFQSVGSVRPELPFAVVEVPPESCVLLASQPSDKSSIRTRGGTLAAGPASGSVAWCTSNAALVVAQHEGTEALDVMIAPAKDAGGVLGTISAARAAKISIGASGIPGPDHGWNAKQLLLASAVPEALISIANAPDLGNDTEARLVALSLDRPKSLFRTCPPTSFHSAIHRSTRRPRPSASSPVRRSGVSTGRRRSPGSHGQSCRSGSSA